MWTVGCEENENVNLDHGNEHATRPGKGGELRNGLFTSTRIRREKNG
jgi:hypothetical protein